MHKIIILLISIILGLFLMFFLGINYQKQITKINCCEKYNIHKLCE